MSTHDLDLIIRSSDRVTGTASEYSVSIPGIVRETPWSRVFCHSVYMHGSMFNVDTTNNTFSYSYVAVGVNDSLLEEQAYRYARSVTLAPGYYTHRTLATALRNAIIDQHVALGGGMPALALTLSGSDATKLFEFGVSTSDYAGLYDLAVANTLPGLNLFANINYRSYFIVPHDGSALYPVTASGSLNTLMGFVNLSTQYASYVGVAPTLYYSPYEFVSTQPHTLDSLPVLFLHCDLVRPEAAFASHDTGLRRIIATITTPAFGTSGVWETSDPPSKTFTIPSSAPASIQLRWTDINDKVVDFQGVDHVIILRFIR